MSSDPAMLIWLDGRDSKKGNPNENYARELMELFSLGIGHYTEKDIREAARAFTGWEIQGTKAVFKPSSTTTATRPSWARPATGRATTSSASAWSRSRRPRFIAGKLFRFLISETAAADAGTAGAAGRRSSARAATTSARWSRRCCRRTCSSRRWSIARAIKSPVDFVLGIVRGLEGTIGTTALAPVAGSNWARTVFTRRRSRAGTAARPGSTVRRCSFARTCALALTSTEDARFGRRADPAALVAQVRQEDRRPRWWISSCGCSSRATCRPSRGRGCSIINASAHSNAVAGILDRTRTPPTIASAALCHLVLTLPEYQLRLSEFTSARPAIRTARRDRSSDRSIRTRALTRPARPIKEHSHDRESS